MVTDTHTDRQADTHAHTHTHYEYCNLAGARLLMYQCNAVYNLNLYACFRTDLGEERTTENMGRFTGALWTSQITISIIS